MTTYLEDSSCWRTNSQRARASGGRERRRTTRAKAVALCVPERGPDRGPARPGESLAGGCSPAVSPARERAAEFTDLVARRTHAWPHLLARGGRPGLWRSVRPDRRRRRWRSKGRQVADADPGAGDGTLATVRLLEVAAITRKGAAVASWRIGSIGQAAAGGIIPVRGWRSGGSLPSGVRPCSIAPGPAPEKLHARTPERAAQGH